MAHLSIPGSTTPGADRIPRADGAGRLDPDWLPSETGNTIWVDAVNGDDGTGETGRQDLPFATPAAALAVAVDGDAIRVRPGSYVLSAGLTIPTGVTLTGEDARQCQLKYTGALAITMVTIGTRGLLDSVDILSQPSAAVMVKGVQITVASGVCHRVNTNPNTTGDHIGCEITATGVSSTGKARLLRCALLGTGSGEALRVSGSGTFLISQCNLDGLGVSASGVRLLSGTTTFETSKLGGTIGLQVLSGGNASLASNASVSVYDIQPGGTLVQDAESFPRNQTMTFAPMVSDDISVGFDIGSRWLDTATDNLYLCTDSTEGAAVWQFLRTTHEQRISFAAETGTSLTVVDNIDTLTMPSSPAGRGGHGAKVIPNEVDLTSDPIVKFYLVVVGTGAGDGTVDLTVQIRYIATAGENTNKAFDESFTKTVSITNVLKRAHEAEITLDRTLIAPTDLLVLILTRAGTGTFTGSVGLVTSGLIEFGE